MNIKLLQEWEIAKEQGISRLECAKKEGMTFEEYKYALEKARKEIGNSDTVSEPIIDEDGFGEIIFEDKKVAEDIGWREYVDLALKAQDINKRSSDIQRTASITIKTDKPIAITYTSDWHLGDGATDHASWLSDMEMMINCPYLYMIDLGDDRQNAKTFKVLSVVLGQVLSPKQQARLVKNLIDELTEKKKLLAKVGGNHDEEFDERLLGEALQSYLLAKIKAPRFSNRGLLKLKIGKETYTNLLLHKSRYSSFLRTNHGNMREHQLSYPADIVASGHNHAPGFEIFNRYELARDAGLPFGGESFLIKTGTYQDSSYGWKYFHGGGMGNPTVILFPDRHKKLIFMDAKDAIDYLSLYY